MDTESRGATRLAADDLLRLTVDTPRIAYFDVMANDGGGKGKALYSLDDGYLFGWKTPIGLLIPDFGRSASTSWDTSVKGARIWITKDGKVGYDAATLPNAIKQQITALSAGESLEDSFTYAMRLGNGTLSWATATIKLTGLNDGPVAVADTISIKEDASPGIVIGNVLANDKDPDIGDSLKVTNVGTFALNHGSLIVRADGSYAYTLDNGDPAVNALNDGDKLSDSFTYNISDGNGGTSSAKLVITIGGTSDNTAPSAADDAAVVREDTAPNPVTGNVLVNDTDAEGHALAVTNVGTFALDHGMLVLRADGSYSYTLDNSDPAVNALNDGDTLSDSFTYNVSDGNGGTNSAKLVITIGGTSDNTAPSAADDAAVVREDTAPNPVTGNVLVNDTDAEGHALAVTNVGTFALNHGMLVLRADGNYSYTLDNNDPAVNTLNDGDKLSDSFTYNVSDGHGGTNSAKLVITIGGTSDNTAPSAADDAAVVREDTAPNPVTGNLLFNDTDAEGHALAVTNVGTFALDHGMLVLRADGNYSYTLDNNDPAVNALNDGDKLSDSFTYNVSDGNGGTNSAKLVITIGGTSDNTAPSAADDAAVVREDTAPNPVTGNVLVNDTDAEGHGLAVTNVGTFALDHGMLVLRADGNYSYTLDNNDPAVNALNDGDKLSDSFTYNVSDGHGGTNSAKLVITIGGTSDNTAPSAADDAAVVREDTAPNPVTGNVLVNDTDAEGHTLAVTNVGTFALNHGTLIVRADGNYSYTLDNSDPAVNALNDGDKLSDSFTYNISDGNGGTNSAKLVITIGGTSDNTAPASADIAGRSVNFMYDAFAGDPDFPDYVSIGVGSSPGASTDTVQLTGQSLANDAFLSISYFV